METAIKIAQLVFFLAAAASVSYMGISSYLKEQEWKKERAEAETKFKDFDKFARNLMLNITDRIASRRGDQKTIN